MGIESDILPLTDLSGPGIDDAGQAGTASAGGLSGGDSLDGIGSFDGVGDVTIDLPANALPASSTGEAAFDSARLDAYATNVLAPILAPDPG